MQLPSLFREFCTDVRTFTALPDISRAIFGVLYIIDSSGHPGKGPKRIYKWMVPTQ